MILRLVSRQAPTVTNPLIVADEAERAAAQAVVDQTPQEVKDFDA